MHSIVFINSYKGASLLADSVHVVAMTAPLERIPASVNMLDNVDQEAQRVSIKKMRG